MIKQTISSGSLSLLERALFILQDGIGIVEKDFTISYINSAAQDLLEKQYNLRPTVGDYFLDFVNSERLDIHKEFISKAFENDASVMEIDFPGPVWYEIGYYPMPDEKGAITNVCVKARDITEAKLLEKKLMQERKERKNKIIKATIEAQEKERSMIGRELHDNVNQVLTTVKLYTELSCSEEVPNKELLKRAVYQINYCIEEIRNLSRRLAVPKLGELGLEELIRDLVEMINITKKTSIKFLSYGIKNREFNQELTTTIYRIVQEQLTNVIKYAHANSVKVIIAGTQQDIAIQVQDNGIGFDLKEKSKGNGVTNMISRAETFRGSLRFETSPGNGCTMTVEFPLEP
jgi:signal transduction histidine kinase